MSEKPQEGVPQGWSFQLGKLSKGGEYSLKDPLGYKCPTGDVVVKNASGKKNLTQIEVLESVSPLD